MNEQYKNELFAELAAKPPAQRAALIEQLELSDDERAEIQSMGEAADALWLIAHSAPALEDDRTAALLGLVPDHSVALDGKKLSQLRKRAGLKIDELAKRLMERGWQVTTKEVFAWERGTTDSVPPALIEVISQVLGAQMDQIVDKQRDASKNRTQLQRLREHPEFEKLARRWAQLKNVSFELAESMLSARAAATVHRGEKPSLAQDIASLEELVASFERSQEK